MHHVCWVVWYCLQLTSGRNYKPTPTQCLLNLGPASAVLAIIHSVLSQYRLYHRKRWRESKTDSPPHRLTDWDPANTDRWTSADLMLGQRCIRWANISPALGQRLVFDRLHDRRNAQTQAERTKVKQHVPISLWEGRHIDRHRQHIYY